jgi:hypothetical protein
MIHPIIPNAKDSEVQVGVTEILLDTVEILAEKMEEIL